jgi:hypothetical protein
MPTSDAAAPSTESADHDPLSNHAPSPAEAVTVRLAALETLSYAELRAEWRRLYRVLPPKRVARELLLLGVAWKIQEQALGGLGTGAKRALASLTQALEQEGDVKRNRVMQLKPGAKLVREWHRSTHTVLVLDEGFEWRGKRWRSLSTIAQAISGAHWSGPRFFGLTARGTRSELRRGKGGEG